MIIESQPPSDSDILDLFVLNAAKSATGHPNRKAHFSTHRHQLIEKNRLAHGWISILEISQGNRVYTQMQYCENQPDSDITMISPVDRMLFNKNTGEIIAQNITSDMNEIIYNESADKKNRIHMATNIKSWRP